MIKSIYAKCKAKIIFSGERLKDKNRTKLPIFTTAIQPCAGSSN